MGSRVRKEGEGRREEEEEVTHHKHEFILIVHLELESDSSMVECIGTPTLLRRQETEMQGIQGERNGI